MMDHMDRLIELKGERVGMKEMRSHGPWYVRGMKGAASLRAQLAQVSTRQDLMKILQNYDDNKKEDR